MDVSDASYYIYIEKKKNKGSQMGHTKKIFKGKEQLTGIYKSDIIPQSQVIFLIKQICKHYSTIV
jgi:hypothetical protein